MQFSLGRSGRSGDHDDGARTLRQRTRLPSGRAIAGGLLVALSGLGLATAHDAATAEPTTQFLVVTEAVDAGERIDRAHLGWVTTALADDLARTSFTDPDEALGRIALTAIPANSLLHRDHLGDAPPREDGPARRVTLEMEPARALDGTLRSGDVVDVVASGGQPGSTEVIIDGALVESVGRPDDDRIGSAGKVRLTLVVADELAATVLIDAAEHQRVTLVTASPVRMGAS